MSFYVGIDGGGTRSRAVLVDEAGRELARVEGSACAIDPTDIERSIHVIAPLVRGLRQATGVEGLITRVWAGVAGAGREGPRQALLAGLQEEGIALHVRVGTDLEAAFYAAFEDGAGIMLISGTGSIVQGRGAEGTVARAGGWGRVMGDPGSGYEIGRAGLRAIAAMEDGSGEETALWESLLPAMGLGDTAGLVEWAASASPGDMAGLAPVVCAVADEGDTVAERIVAEAAAALAGMVRAVRDHLAPWPDTPSLALEGGMVRPPSGALRGALMPRLAELDVTVRVDAVDPAMGAARLAMVGGL